MPFSLKRHRGVLYGAVTVRFMRKQTLTTPDGPERHRRFCRQSQTLVGALIPAVVMSGVVDSERKIDANDPTRTSTASARARLGVRSSNLFRTGLRPKEWPMCTRCYATTCTTVATEAI